MNRRDALSRVSLILGGTILGAEMWLSGCTNPQKNIGAGGINFSNDDVAFLNEVSETILPATDSPGAKEAKVGEFMTRIVRDCYAPEDQKIFVEGVHKLNEASKQKNGSYFMDATPEQRHDLLVELDKESKDYQGKKKDSDPKHYFRMIKELTLWGYFTSEDGAKKALVYVEVPGRYEGCLDYKKGQKAWATS
jgi:Gluconate 2-dehydrogenase subunit 3